MRKPTIIPVTEVRPVDKIWFTRKDAAAYLGVSRDFVKALCLSGRLQSYKVCASNSKSAKDGVSFIKKSDLDSFIGRSEHRVSVHGVP